MREYKPTLEDMKRIKYIALLETIKVYWYFFFFAIFLMSIPFTIIESERGQQQEFLPCYDKYGNKIIGELCHNENIITEEQLYWSYILTILSIIIFLLILINVFISSYKSTIHHKIWTLKFEKEHKK